MKNGCFSFGCAPAYLRAVMNAAPAVSASTAIGQMPIAAAPAQPGGQTSPDQFRNIYQNLPGVAGGGDGDGNGDSSQNPAPVQTNKSVESNKKKTPDAGTSAAAAGPASATAGAPSAARALTLSLPTATTPAEAEVEKLQSAPQPNEGGLAGQSETSQSAGPNPRAARNAAALMRGTLAALNIASPIRALVAQKESSAQPQNPQPTKKSETNTPAQAADQTQGTPSSLAAVPAFAAPVPNPAISPAPAAIPNGSADNGRGGNPPADSSSSRGVSANDTAANSASGTTFALRSDNLAFALQLASTSPAEASQSATAAASTAQSQKDVRAAQPNLARADVAEAANSAKDSAGPLESGSPGSAQADVQTAAAAWSVPATGRVLLNESELNAPALQDESKSAIPAAENRAPSLRVTAPLPAIQKTPSPADQQAASGSSNAAKSATMPRDARSSTQPDTARQAATTDSKSGKPADAVETSRDSSPQTALQGTLPEAPVLNAAAQPIDLSSGAAASQAPAPARPNLSTVLPEVQPLVAETPKTSASSEIVLQVANGQASAAVRVIERAGTINVAVHAPDQDLRSSLRSNLSDLATQLNAQGLKSDAQKTVATQAAAENRPDPGTQDQRSPGQQHSAPQGDRQPQRDRRSASRWLEELQQQTSVNPGNSETTNA